MTSRPAVRCLLLPLAEVMWLVPSTVVAEVLGDAELVGSDHMPPWVMGTVDWRGRHVPVLSTVPESVAGGIVSDDCQRLAILYALSQNSRQLPFFGVLLQKLPRVLLASERTVRTRPGGPPASRYALADVHVDGREAVIPDLDAIEGALAGVLTGSQA